GRTVFIHNANNRELITLVECIRATGEVIPPLIIVKAATIIDVSEKAWTTNKLGFGWLKHFDEHTKRKVVRTHRLLISDSHESHNSLVFQNYCKDNNTVTLSKPPHSSHLLQPLDVGCFTPLKQAYGRQVEALMRSQINHITKQEFLPCFKR
ncbi:hypothetical protein COCVIDRAFT_71227, partial [Bipolaris victoriae FI3]